MANKPDSQDICFVPGGDYAAVIKKYRPKSFQSGNILELDHRTGNIISVQKLKLKNINYVYFIDKYILINQQNGKTSVFIQ